MIECSRDFPRPDLRPRFGPGPFSIKNEQKLPKMVFIIPNFFVLHFCENFMKIRTKRAKLQMHEHLYKNQGTKIFKYCTCPAGRVTYNFHSYCKHMHLSFKSVCNKEHKGVICNMTSSSSSFQSTRPVGRVLWEELLVLSRFRS